MSDKSNIEWTDATWNPIVGCSIVSPACTNCYAMPMAARLDRMMPSVRRGDATIPSHYAALTKPSKAGPVWTGRVTLAPDHILTKPLRWKKPRKIFVNSMGDLFHESVPDEWIDRVFAVMASSSRHTFQVLTKRPKRMRAYLRAIEAEGPSRLRHYVDVTMARGRTARQALNPPMREPDDPTPELRALYDRVKTHDWSRAGRYGLGEFHWQEWPLSNVWLGVTAEDQTRADERIPDLCATPAAKRFVSCEPLLSEIRLDLISIPDNSVVLGARAPSLAFLDQIITGGESGPKARPSNPDWFRSLRDQCATAGTAFFFKQWGEWAPGNAFGLCSDGPINSARGGVRDWMNRYVVCNDRADRIRAHSFTEHSTYLVYRVGKKRAGSLLDGIAHKVFPA